MRGHVVYTQPARPTSRASPGYWMLLNFFSFRFSQPRVNDTPWVRNATAAAGFKNAFGKGDGEAFVVAVGIHKKF